MTEQTMEAQVQEVLDKFVRFFFVMAVTVN